MIEKRIENSVARRTSACRRSVHQQLVDAFMLGAGQQVPSAPCDRDPQTACLRAKLILEAALETVCALGVDVRVVFEDERGRRRVQALPNSEELVFEKVSQTDLVELADGCCDLAVVTTGTLSAYGVSGEAIQLETDQNNLLKFGKGYQLREDGKLIKPPNHPLPRIAEILDIQRSAICRASELPDE